MSYTIEVSLDKPLRIMFDAVPEPGEVDRAIGDMSAKMMEVGVPVPCEFWIGMQGDGQGRFGMTMRINHYTDQNGRRLGGES